MPRGVFISLDGPDGGGKSTQGRLLAEWVRGQGRAVVTCVDPGGTALGTRLREMLLQERGEMAPAAEALLFMASRAQLVHEVIRPALEAGQVVVSDRYLLANVVYQGYGGGLDVEQLWESGNLSTGGIEPDLTLVLDVPVEIAVARRLRPADRMESRDTAYQERVRQGFLTEARRRPQKCAVIDATQPVEAVQAAIRAAVAPVLHQEGS